MTQSQETAHKPAAPKISVEDASRAAKAINRLVNSKKNDTLKFPLLDDVGSLHKLMVATKKEMVLKSSDAAACSLLGNRMRKALLCLKETGEALSAQLGTVIDSRKAKASELSTLRDEILALNTEFPDGARYNKESGTHGAISIITPPVILEGVELGRFEVAFRLEYFSCIRSHFGAFVATGLEPNPSGDGFEHPHIENGHICIGDGVDAVANAMIDLRICDAFTILRGVLMTYGASPYRHLDNWHGGECPNCGSRASATYCDRCDAELCHDCYTSCDVCESRICNDCCYSCEDCGKYLCTDCFVKSEFGIVRCARCAEAHADKANKGSAEKVKA